MKKIAIIICFMMILCGCGKETKEDVIKDLDNMVKNVKSYKLTGTMEINNDEEKFNYSLESSYLKDNYYKVRLVNLTNNHEQIILKNNQDVYVITPSLNKSFKFQSDWPNNSSQAYLYESIIKDIKNDTSVEIEEKDNIHIIKSKVNYPNNEELKYQKIYLNKDKKIEKVEVFDENDTVKIKVTFTNIDLKAKLKEKDFDLKNYITEDNNGNNNGNNSSNTDAKKNNNKEPNNNTTNEEKNNTTNTENNTKENKENCNSENDKSCQIKDEKTGTIENIIYPLYIPSNTYLTSAEKIYLQDKNRVILTFSGEKNFVLIEEIATAKSEMEIVPVYGEPLMLSESIGALSANSLSWDKGNISYYLASTELSKGEMKTIANSLGNNTLVNKEK